AAHLAAQVGIVLEGAVGRHVLRPGSGNGGELPADGEGAQAATGADLVDLGDEVVLVAGGVGRAGESNEGDAGDDQGQQGAPMKASGHSVSPSGSWVGPRGTRMPPFGSPAAVGTEVPLGSWLCV